MISETGPLSQELRGIMNTFVFDIETVPDLSTLRQQHDFAGLSDEQVLEAVMSLSRAQRNTEFLPLYLQRVVCISVVLRTPSRFMVWSLGEESSGEAELITRFFEGIDKYTPSLVSWNGSGFDLPVLHYRALLHGISAPRYWETGENDTQFRYNNYLSRYHYRHLDLMDVLASYNARAFAPLDGIATLLGFPGKMGQSGASVAEQFFSGEIKAIRNYCETDVLNTYLIYLRFQLLRGMITKAEYDNEIEQVKNQLKEFNKPHLAEFLSKM